MGKEKNIEEILDNVRVPSDEEVEMAGLRFERRLRRERCRRNTIWGITSTAAVILCGVMFSLLRVDGEKDDEIEMAGDGDIAKHERAVVVPTLILSDGNCLDLEGKNMDTTILQSAIQVSDNHIKYDTLPSVKEIVYNTLVIPAGYTYNVTLADGTEVVLNAGSCLKYPVEFVGEERNVELSGEAFFNVMKSGKPFVVNVCDSKIRVYGTQFNVKIFLGNTIETALVSGKIGFKSPNRDEVQVVPGEAVTYDVISEDFEVEKMDVQYVTAWMNGVFKYQGRRLDLVLDDISAWYGIEFDSQIDLTLMEITMNLSKETPIEEVISFMELITDFEFIKKGRYYIIEKRE